MFGEQVKQLRIQPKNLIWPNTTYFLFILSYLSPTFLSKQYWREL